MVETISQMLFDRLIRHSCEHRNPEIVELRACC